MPDSADSYTPHGVGVDELLQLAGFTWSEPGYWSRLAHGAELTLEPQVMNAGRFKLQLYVGHEPLLGCEVLVDVKPRPGGDH